MVQRGDPVSSRWPPSLRDRSVVVIGGASEIGRAIAEAHSRRVALVNEEVAELIERSRGAKVGETNDADT
ncbi:MAG TPA: hypothetical protein VKA82_04635 [Rubrobacter sp.]|nr:hypothetical protein [Rubrobacter sp.]